VVQISHFFGSLKAALHCNKKKEYQTGKSALKNIKYAFDAV